MEPSIKIILVGIDFSQDSTRALKHAVSLAEKLSARIDMLYVQEPLPQSWSMVRTTEDGDPTRASLEQLRHLRTEIVDNRVPAWIHVRPGRPVSGFLAAINELKPDLVVVGTHGYGALARILMGSVSERLCRTSRVPVLVVPESAEEREAAQARMVELAEPAPREIVWSCLACGHIRGRGESLDRCGKCGQQPGDWTSAPITAGPVDQLEPAASNGLSESVQMERSEEPAGLLAMSPPGTQGYSVNAELRVRY